MLRLLVVLLIGVALLSAVVASAASLEVHGGSIQVFTFEVDLSTPTPQPPVEATVEIEPKSLGQKSTGQPVKANVELPSGYSVAAIDAAGVRLCRGTRPCGSGVAPSDWQLSGKRLRLTFDRAAVLALVADVEPPATVVFAVSGAASDGSFAFLGQDAVQLVDPEKSKTGTPSATPTGVPTPTATATPATTATPAPTEEPAPTPGTPSAPLTPTPAPTYETPTATPAEPTAAASETSVPEGTAPVPSSTPEPIPTVEPATPTEVAPKPPTPTPAPAPEAEPGPTASE